MQYRSVDVRLKANKCDDRDWIQGAFAMLKALLNNEDELLAEFEDRRLFSEMLIKSAVAAVPELESGNL